jgi:hypothetical protein
MPGGFGDEFDFFFSRRGSVAAVAREVADVLIEKGYRSSSRITTSGSAGRKSMSVSRPCGLKSHGSKREEPNKHLSAPPPPFLSSTFAKLVEVFDRRGVSFVSTTLPNATRSAGGHRRPP